VARSFYSLLWSNYASQIVGQTLLECEQSQYGVSGGQCLGCHGWGGLVSVGARGGGASRGVDGDMEVGTSRGGLAGAAED